MVLMETTVLGLTATSFRHEVLECEQPALVLFRSVWSASSDIMESRLAQTAMRYAGKVKTCKLDLNADARLAADYHVLTVPTVLVFKDGELVDRLSGFVSEAILKTKVDALLG